MKVYLDNAASTKMDKRVVDAMIPFFLEKYAVPSSQFAHTYGLAVKDAVDGARTSFADRVGGKYPEEIIFTSGGTEANNLAIKGVAHANTSKGKHLITTEVEHNSVLNSFRRLEEEGFEVSYLPVNKDGIIDMDVLKHCIKKETALISVQYGNHETGTVQDIREIAKLSKEKGILFHTDAAIAWPYLPIDAYNWGIDLITLSPHKFYGPKGVGILFVRKGTKIKKVLDGGFNEFNLRPGTENTPAIIGAQKAAEIFRRKDVDRVLLLKKRLIAGIKTTIKHVEYNGSKENSLPHIANLTFKYIEGEAVSLRLDFEGIAVITGSACYSRNLQASYILLAMGKNHEQAHGSIRFSLSKYNTEEEIDYTIQKAGEVVSDLRELSPLGKENGE